PRPPFFSLKIYNSPAPAARNPAPSPFKMNPLLSAPNMRIQMVGRGGIIAAFLVYLGISVGCVIFAPPQSKTEISQHSAHAQHVGGRPTRVAGLPFRGVAMQLQRVDFMDGEYQKSIDEIVDVGADTVLFV